MQSASASSRATVAEAARSTASAAQLAQTSVDTDEETVNMLAFQRAYEGAARVLTAEHRIYPQSVRWFVEDALVWSGDTVQHRDGAPQQLLLS